jgi:DNA-binding transcriptional MerR regulator
MDYPEPYVDRVRLIKRLQEDRFLPLREIARLLEGTDGEERARALLAAESRILERARAVHEDSRREAAEVRDAYDVPENVLDRLAELEVLTPTEAGYDREDIQIIEAMVAFRSGGFDEAPGFTVHDTLRYREAIAPLVAEEVRAFLDRLTDQVAPDRAAEIIASGERPLRELIGALHAKLLRVELRRQFEAAHGPFTASGS